jgi:tRNA G18 (ribose-2'-O)-methylase SpoU
MKKLSMDALGRVSAETYKELPKRPIVILLDNIRSLHNVGTFFRTGDAFNIAAIALCGITGTPPHKDIQKTALGATESVRWQYFPQSIHAIEQYKSQGYAIIAIEQTDESIALPDWKTIPEKIVLVFGHEVNGVAQEVLDLCDCAVEVPQFGTKHSFNVSVVGGIVLYHICCLQSSDFS